MIYDVLASRLGHFTVVANSEPEAREKIINALQNDFTWDGDFTIIDITTSKGEAQ